ncbi:MAG: hypothetical protein JNK82_02945 [Myxococcaceae bacterium]|nr:hypothetical protein [Myxococcaceae bacterium]
MLLLLLVLSAEPVVEDREPPLVFFFETDGGKRVPVELDKPFNPAELGKTATLKVEPHRRFAYAGVELEYPREYGFEQSGEGAFTSWTLSGNDAKVMVQRYKGQKKTDVVHKAVVAEVQKAYGGKAKESPATLQAGGRTLEGTRLEVEVMGTFIVQELFPLKSGGDVVELIIQDSPKKLGEPSAERARTVKLISDTLKLPPAK